MFSKIGNMLSNAWTGAKNLIKPLKHGISSGWESLKNGAEKVGRFIGNNHEAIGSIMSGVGSILSNMPNSPIKQKLNQYGGNASHFSNLFGGFSNNNNQRPSNAQRPQFMNNLTRPNQPAQQNQSMNNSNPSGSIHLSGFGRIL